jgi:hypothetical protein
MTEHRMRSRILTAAAIAAGLALGGCDSFDPLDKLSELDIMGTAKKPLQGERRPVFDSGVPGVPQGVPPELVKGYQPPPEAPPPVIEAKPEKKVKPRKTAAVPRKPRPQPQAQQEQPQQTPTARTTTQPVGQSSAGTQTMPGAQPTWPTNAPPAPGPWAGPQR